MNKNILILSLGFSPNVGGVETHLDDLLVVLDRDGWKSIVLTYQPLHTPKLGKWIERRNQAMIYRLPSVRGWFYKLANKPFLEFLFLSPLLFLSTPIILLTSPKVEIINAQGIICGFVAAFWSKVFNKRYVISTQSVYSFPNHGLYTSLARWIFSQADSVLAISQQSANGVIELGLNPKKVHVFTHWEDTTRFKPLPKQKSKERVDFANKFVVSFFGRLVTEKGIEVLLDSVKLIDPKVTLAIYGEGPLKKEVENAAHKYKNVIYMKTVPPTELPLHYSAADLLIVPSTHEEGFGRVAAGALLCGTPVIASNRGALPEVVNDKVGKIIQATPQEISKAINFFSRHQEDLIKRAKRARTYALGKFSDKNARIILDQYQG